MANLVSPGYKQNKLINSILYPTEERTIEFLGLNRMPVRADGEMLEMMNLTSDNYPLLAPRKPRGTYALPSGAVLPYQIATRYNRIALIAKDSGDVVNFYYDGTKITAVNDLTETSRMVSINTKLCFFPQKTYLTLTSSGTSVVVGDYKSLEEKVTITSGSAVNVTVGDEYVTIALSSSNDFAYDDVVNIDGTITSYDSNNSAIKTASVNTPCLITGKSGNSIHIEDGALNGYIDPSAVTIKFYGKIERSMPTLDMVLEWNNRLWGASNSENTIYACKLGDPTNWQYFQGTSLDSYYAQQGTDGLWTGCAPYSSHVIFFKQGSMTRIYGSSPSTFQLTNTQCFGVEEGSSKSIEVINDKVFYKSVVGIMAYDGGIPYCISDKFNTEFKSVIGGTEGKKYYASIQTKDKGYELLVLDVEKAVWHKEGATTRNGFVRFKDTCTLDNKLFFITHESESIKCSNDLKCSDWLLCGSGTPTAGEVNVVNPDNNTENFSDLEWMAVFGPFDEYMENRKIYSRLLLRLARKADSEVSVYISINEGPWELVQKFDPATTGGDYIPIIPRRCDRYAVKIEGRGDCSIKSLTRKVRMGTGGRL